MLPVLQVGPLAIQLSGLLLLVGLWLGLSLTERYAPQRGVSPNNLYNLVFIVLVAGVIGARLGYVFRYPDVFLDSPLSILSPNPGLFDVWIGLVTGGIAALIYGQRKNMPLWPALDALTPLLGVMSIAMALAHLSSGVAFGAPTTLPWGIELWGARRHPTQIYHLLSAGLILAILWPGRPLLNDKPPGWYFLTFVAASAGARILIEAFRGDSLLLPGGIRTAQVIAWLVLAASLWGLTHIHQSKPEGEHTHV